MQVKTDQEAYIDVLLPGGNEPLRGRKGAVYDGGIRVPAFAYWPGQLQPGTCDAPVHVSDWMPTLSALVGHRPQQDLKWDGLDAWPDISGLEINAAARTIYTKSRRASALQFGDWKLIQQQNEIELYHIIDDEGESKNLAEENPEVVKQLLGLLEAEAAKDNDALPETE